MYKKVHSTTIWTGKNWKTATMPIDNHTGWLNFETVTYGILYSNQNDLQPPPVIWMELTNLILSKGRHKRDILYDSVYRKFENRQNESTLSEMRMVLSWGIGQWCPKGAWGGLLDDGHALFLGESAGYMDAFRLWKLIELHTYAPFSMCMLYFDKNFKIWY